MTKSDINYNKTQNNAGVEIPAPFYNIISGKPGLLELDDINWRDAELYYAHSGGLKFNNTNKEASQITNKKDWLTPNDNYVHDGEAPQWMQDGIIKNSGDLLDMINYLMWRIQNVDYFLDNWDTRNAQVPDMWFCSSITKEEIIRRFEQLEIPIALHENYFIDITDSSIDPNYIILNNITNKDIYLRPLKVSENGNSTFINTFCLDSKDPNPDNILTNSDRYLLISKGSGALENATQLSTNEENNIIINIYNKNSTDAYADTFSTLSIEVKNIPTRSNTTPYNVYNIIRSWGMSHNFSNLLPEQDSYLLRLKINKHSGLGGNAESIVNYSDRQFEYDLSIKKTEQENLTSTTFSDKQLVVVNSQYPTNPVTELSIVSTETFYVICNLKYEEEYGIDKYFFISENGTIVNENGFSLDGNNKFNKYSCDYGTITKSGNNYVFEPNGELDITNSSKTIKIECFATYYNSNGYRPVKPLAAASDTITLNGRKSNRMVFFTDNWSEAIGSEALYRYMNNRYQIIQPENDWLAAGREFIDYVHWANYADDIPIDYAIKTIKFSATANQMIIPNLKYSIATSLYSGDIKIDFLGQIDPVSGVTRSISNNNKLTITNKSDSTITKQFDIITENKKLIGENTRSFNYIYLDDEVGKSLFDLDLNTITSGGIPYETDVYLSENIIDINNGIQYNSTVYTYEGTNVFSIDNYELSGNDTETVNNIKCDGKNAIRISLYGSTAKYPTKNGITNNSGNIFDADHDYYYLVFKIYVDENSDNAQYGYDRAECYYILRVIRGDYTPMLDFNDDKSFNIPDKKLYLKDIITDDAKAQISKHGGNQFWYFHGVDDPNVAVSWDDTKVAIDNKIPGQESDRPFIELKNTNSISTSYLIVNKLVKAYYSNDEVIQYGKIPNEQMALTLNVSLGNSIKYNRALYINQNDIIIYKKNYELILKTKSNGNTYTTLTGPLQINGNFSSDNFNSESPHITSVYLCSDNTDIGTGTVADAVVFYINSGRKLVINDSVITISGDDINVVPLDNVNTNISDIEDNGKKVRAVIINPSNNADLVIYLLPSTQMTNSDSAILHIKVDGDADGIYKDGYIEQTLTLASE